MKKKLVLRKSNLAIGQLLLSIFLGGTSFCQSLKVTYGTLDTNRITVEDFNKQKQLEIPKDYNIDSATIFFSLPGQSHLISVEYLPLCDSLKFNTYKKLLTPGATVYFTINLIHKYQKTKHIKHLNYIFYSMAKTETLPLQSASTIEFKRLSVLNYRAGTIYFSGTNFSNVIIINISKTNPDVLKNIFMRCASGSVITFENATYQDKDKSLITLNQTLNLE